MNKQIVVFSFERNISHAVLESLPVSHKSFLKSEENAITQFVETIVAKYPSFILGLGAYSGRDRDALRIETVCSNKFRNTLQGKTYEEIDISHGLKPTTKSKIAKGMGNSYCNFTSYLMMKTMRKMNVSTQYAFIHIPKTFDIDVAVTEITQLINTIE